MKPQFMIGSGWFVPQEDNNKKDVFRYWLGCLDRYPDAEIAIISVGNSRLPPHARSGKVQVLELSGNLGHVFDLIEKRKPYHFCGWSMAVCALALLAYLNECDLVYLEQDCLAFGPFVEQMYKELGDAKCIFGDAADKQPASQSLFLIKRDFLTEFVRLYLDTGPETSLVNTPEQKFARLESGHPRLFKRFSFPCERKRPLPLAEPIWYAQHLTNEELEQIKKAGLI